MKKEQARLKRLPLKLAFQLQKPRSGYILLASVSFLFLYAIFTLCIDWQDWQSKGCRVVFFASKMAPNFQPLSDETDKCEPYDRTYVPYKVNIDSQVYPRSVRLHLNNTLNFTCLNSGRTKTKKILYWNSFFDNANFSFGLGFRQPFERNNCPVCV